MVEADQLMLRTVLTIFGLGAFYGLWCLRPLYWRLLATHVRPFHHGDSQPTDKSSLDNEFLASLSAAAESTKKGIQLGKPDEGGMLKEVTRQEDFKAEDYVLTKKLVSSHMKGGYIMITWANLHYADFADNWQFHVQKAGVKGFMIGAMDDDMLRYLVASKTPTWRMATGIKKDDLGWGSPDFHKMGRFKIALIKQFLELAVTDVIVSDIDTVWMRNPLPYFDRFPEADVLTSSDHLDIKDGDEFLAPFPQTGSAFNIGIMLFRRTSKHFVEDWIKALQKPNVWDQSAFNDLALLNFRPSNSSGLTKNLFKGYNGSINVGVLPLVHFASGHVFFTQKKHLEWKVDPYVAHATYQYSGTPGKRHRFREQLLWNDPPAYFNSHKGYISMTIDIPAPLWAAAATADVTGDITPQMLPAHFNLVHYQLTQLRAALTLSYLTGRIVIMPPIWCLLDKYWAPLSNGNIPGAHFIKPFICPMDHIMETEATWYGATNENTYGSHIGWREYSFLQNTRLPRAVNESWLELLVTTAAASSVLKGKQLSVASGLTAPQLQQELLKQAPPSSTSILHLPPSTLTALSQLYKSMLDGDAAKHTAWLKHATTVFCCMKNSPSHIWYDFFADVDHVDRANREFKGGKFVIYAGDGPTELIKSQ